MADNKITGSTPANINNIQVTPQTTEVKNIFVNSAIGSFFDTLTSPNEKLNFSWSNNVLDEIRNLKARTEEYKEILKPENGNELNIIG